MSEKVFTPEADTHTNRTLAIGDVHGCLTALDTLLLELQPDAHDHIIMLGDYTDRGPDSRGVIDRLIAMQAEWNCVFLCGNHDEMMCDSLGGRSAASMWVIYGGIETLQSYSADGTRINFDDVPENHRTFMNTLVDYHETDSHIFVHACVLPDQPLAKQDKRTLRWQKLYVAKPHASGKTVICGHTSQNSGLPRDFGHTLCIDTHVYGGGWLSCLDLATMTVLQANQEGETRSVLRSDFVTDPETPAVYDE